MYVDMNKVYAYTMLPITIEQTKQGEISRIMWQNDIWGIIRFVNCVTIKISDIEQMQIIRQKLLSFSKFQILKNNHCDVLHLKYPNITAL